MNKSTLLNFYNSHKNKLGLLLIAIVAIGFWAVTDRKLSDVRDDVAEIYSPLRPYLPDEAQEQIDGLFVELEKIAPTIAELEEWIDDQEQKEDDIVSYGYQTLIHSDGPDKLVCESGGEIEVLSGGTLDIQSGATFSFAGLYPLGYASASQEIECGVTATFTDTTAITATALTTATYVLAIQITDPAATASILTVDAPSANVFSIDSWESDFTVGTTGITAYWCAIGNQ